MSSNDTYLAVFTGTQARREAWQAKPEAERKAAEQKGRAAWGEWMNKHGDAVVAGGGPLGKTKRISRDGIADVRNELAAFLVVRAASHEAAAKMFEGHPHFTIFPGEAVDVMPVLPVPA
jgi:hypothetical protein